MSEMRPLPARPSLEFERKEAKTLLRALRRNEPTAAERAHAFHPNASSTFGMAATLADAQLIIAREFGFASWPRLVKYYQAAERQRYGANSVQFGADHFRERVSRMVAHTGPWSTITARELVTYVPRPYGMRTDDMLNERVTEDEARLMLARGSGCTTWDDLIARADEYQAPRADNAWADNPWRLADVAMRAIDVDALDQLVERFPELMHSAWSCNGRGLDLALNAFTCETRIGRDRMRPILEWLERRGVDMHLALNRQLCGFVYIGAGEVAALLDRGADPNWIAPNGYTVLEHAVVRYWNGDAVDLIATRVKPRDSWWVAAGIGDVKGVKRFLDRNGMPNAAARDDRPDFTAIGPFPMPMVPSADDEQILVETFMIAMWNGRSNVMKYMAKPGTNVNSLSWGMTLATMAAGNGWVRAMESLVQCGADVNLQGLYNGSAREMARQMLETQTDTPDRRRIAELCGLDPDAVLAERNARPLPTPTVHRDLTATLALASDDAARNNQSHVQRENLLYGLLRAGKLPMMFFSQISEMDVERFRDEVASRVHPANEPPLDRSRPLDTEAQAILNEAIAMAAQRRRDTVTGLHLLLALLRDQHGETVSLLTRFNGNLARLSDELAKAI